MKDWVLHYWANVYIAISLYWLPLVLCLVGYIVRTWKDYRNDVERREKSPRVYYPILTIGHIIGRGVVSIIPVANLMAAIFDVAPELFSGFFKWIGKVFDQPLVPERKDVSRGTSP